MDLFLGFSFSLLFYLQAVGPLVSHLAPLGLSFCICGVGDPIAFPHSVDVQSLHFSEAERYIQKTLDLGWTLKV